MMDNLPPNQYQEGPASPSQPHIFSVKTEPAHNTDLWNPQLLHPINGVLTENFATYASLETVYPETSSYAPTSNAPQYFAFTNSSNSIQPLYSNTSYSSMQENTDLSEFHSFYRDPDLSLTARDEGLGSSPSSFNSSSPPLLHSAAAQEPVPSTSSSSNYDYTSHPSARNSPVNMAYSQSEVPVSECGNCGSRSDVVWVNNHFLCRCCYDTCTALQPPPEEPPNERKRKRSPAVNKKNLICTNCEAVNTSLWRRSFVGASVCNACGLYEKLHKVPRPKNMRKDTIQTRKRKPKAAAAKPKRKNSSAGRTTLATPKVESYASNNPEQYSLPTYNTIHMRGVTSDPSNNRDAGMLHSFNNSPSPYANYRPEMYMYPVPPNEVINAAPSFSYQHGFPPSPHNLTPPSHGLPSPHNLTPPSHGLPSTSRGLSPSNHTLPPSPHELPPPSPYGSLPSP